MTELHKPTPFNVTGTQAEGKKFVKFVPAAETIMAVDENGTSYIAGYAQVILYLNLTQ